VIKILLALSAFTAASADVAFRWPDSTATTLAAILFGPLVFAIVWLTVRRSDAPDRSDRNEALHHPSSAHFDAAEEAVDL
jgi:hypothetical protein